MQPCGNGLQQRLQIGGVQEVEERKGGRESITTPPAAAAVDTSVLGLIGPEPGRGGGGGGGSDDKDVAVPSRIPDLGSNGGGR